MAVIDRNQRRRAQRFEQAKVRVVVAAIRFVTAPKHRRGHEDVRLRETVNALLWCRP